MKKQLIVGLLSAGVVVAMLPGVTVAKGVDAKAACRKGGWTEWVRQDQTAFVDQAACVAYVAEGGTLATPTPPTFQSACLGLSGTYVAPYVLDYGYILSYPEACTGLHDDNYVTAQAVLPPLCTMAGSSAGWDSSGGVVRCDP